MCSNSSGHTPNCSKALSRNRGLRRPLILLFPCLALGVNACTFSDHLATAAVDYNESVESSSNEILLKNIVRASFDHPIYFSSISILRGNITAQAEISGRVPFGGDAESSFLVSPSVGISTVPSTDIVPDDSQEFMRGLITEIQPELVVNFIQQGWPKWIVLNLLVEKALISDILYSNDPNDDTELAKFQEFAERFDRVTNPKDENHVGPPVPVSPDAALVGIIEAAKAGYSVRPQTAADGSERLQLFQETSKIEFQFFRKDKPDEIEKFEVSPKLLSDTPEGLPAERPDVRLFAVPESARSNTESNEESPGVMEEIPDLNEETQDMIGKEGKDNESGQLLFRTAERVIRYLGDFVDKKYNKGIKRPITIHKGNDNGAAILNIKYFGESYWIDKKDRESMQALSLLSQIIMLNKSREDLPATPTVLSIGQ